MFFSVAVSSFVAVVDVGCADVLMCRVAGALWCGAGCRSFPCRKNAKTRFGPSTGLEHPDNLNILIT